MKQTRVYEVPECELLELRWERDFLDYESQRGVTTEQATINYRGEWD